MGDGDLAYDIAGLRASADQHRAVGDAAARLNGELAAITLAPSALGDVSAAAEFATTLAGAAFGQARGALYEATIAQTPPNGSTPPPRWGRTWWT